MNNRYLYSKIWEVLRRYMNNPSLMPTRSQLVENLLYNGYRSCRTVVKKLNQYCNENNINHKFKSYRGITIGDLLDQAEPLNLDILVESRFNHITQNNYVY